MSIEKIVKEELSHFGKLQDLTFAFLHLNRNHPSEATINNKSLNLKEVFGAYLIKGNGLKAANTEEVVAVEIYFK